MCNFMEEIFTDFKTTFEELRFQENKLTSDKKSGSPTKNCWRSHPKMSQIFSKHFYKETEALQINWH